jgi:hypothetical protein
LEVDVDEEGTGDEHDDGDEDMKHVEEGILPVDLLGSDHGYGGGA